MIEPNNDEVICPKCCHQFRAIPVNVQADLATIREALRHHGEEAAKLIEANDELLTAARAVVARWDSPLWKDQPHTGEFIAALRTAIAKHTTLTTKEDK